MTRQEHGLALLGGTPIFEGLWPRWPRLRNLDETLHRISEVLTGSSWTVRADVPGSYFTELAELAWAERCGTRYALTVTSGSAALELALRALRIGRGQEVIVPALGWYATAAAVSRVGATPIFADIDPKTSCIDPASIIDHISERTVAIIVVHLHCVLADLDSIGQIAMKYHLHLIEDAAQAHGGSYKGRPVGSIGTVGCFSFNQEKQLAVGEGGAIVTNDPDLYQRLYALRTDGYRPCEGTSRQWQPEGSVRGMNCCMSELQAALLLSQIEMFEDEHELRVTNARQLEVALKNSEAIVPLVNTKHTTRRTFYEFGLVCQPNSFGDWPVSLIGRALSAELSARISQTDVPVQASPLFAELKPIKPLPKAAELHDQLLVFHHRLLLYSEVAQLVPAAIEKVSHTARAIPAKVLINSI